MIFSKRLMPIFAVGCLILLAGCVRSIHPIYTQNDLVFEKSLLGQWTSQDAEQSWEFTKKGNKAYRMTFTDDEDRTAKFTTRLTRIDGQLYLDFYPVRKSGKRPGFYDLHTIRTHTFARVDEIGSTLELTFLDLSWLKSHLKESQKALSHETTDNTIVLTASTEEIQAFLNEYRENEDAFSARLVLDRDE